MVHDTAHREGFGRVTPQGGPQEYGGSTLERMGQSLGLSPVGGINCGGNLVGGGDLHIPPPEHSFAVYWDQGHYVPVSGDR